MAADHLGADSNATLWAETTALQQANALLTQVTNPYFRRGEFTP